MDFRLLFACVLVSGCGGGGGGGGGGGADGGPFPVGDVSLPINSLELSLNSLNDSDIDDGFLDKDENIGNGGSDAWTDFVDASEAACGGVPVGLAVQGARLRFTERDGVTTWEELFPRGVSVIFRDTSGSDLAALQVTVATHESPSGAAPLLLTGVASRGDLAELLDALLGGDFHVAVRGPSDLETTFSVSLGISLQLEAYCD